MSKKYALNMVTARIERRAGELFLTEHLRRTPTSRKASPICYRLTMFSKAETQEEAVEEMKKFIDGPITELVIEAVSFYSAELVAICPQCCDYPKCSHGEHEPIEEADWWGPLEEAVEAVKVGDKWEMDVYLTIHHKALPVVETPQEEKAKKVKVSKEVKPKRKFSASRK